jgi:hypothetical protein
MLRKALRKDKQYMNPVPTSVGGWSTFFYVLWAYLTNREERTPKRTLGPFRTGPRVYEHPPASGLRVTSMGHSSSLLEIDGVRVGRSASLPLRCAWTRRRGSMWCFSRTTTTTISGR